MATQANFIDKIRSRDHRFSNFFKKIPLYHDSFSNYVSIWKKFFACILLIGTQANFFDKMESGDHRFLNLKKIKKVLFKHKVCAFYNNWAMQIRYRVLQNFLFKSPNTDIKETMGVFMWHGGQHQCLPLKYLYTFG